MQRTVVISKSPHTEYPATPPFHPYNNYPEYTFGLTDQRPNYVYETVRNCFYLAKLDFANFGKSEWNPLKDLINPGETVLLKPNFVKEKHPKDSNGWQYVITHGSVIRAVADYVFLALGGQGKIILADAPHTDSSFDEIVRINGINALTDFYRLKGIDFQVIDLRKEEWHEKNNVIVSRKALPGDPRGYVALDLAKASEFTGHKGGGNYYGADYETEEVNRHHSNGHHEYLIAGSVLDADVIISLPKMKTHKKTGVTITLKNLVGINGDKNWLPHYTKLSDQTKGDERPNVDAKVRWERTLVSVLQKICLKLPRIGPYVYSLLRNSGLSFFGSNEKVIRSGNWWGNDTTWRMCLDLNKIAVYGSYDGQMAKPNDPITRRHYSLVDGIIGGEGNGPMAPDPVHCGIIAFGTNPAEVDAVCAYFMGYNPDQIPLISQAFKCQEYPLAEFSWRDIKVISNVKEWAGTLNEIDDAVLFHFRPHFGWSGHIERK